MALAILFCAAFGVRGSLGATRLARAPATPADWHRARRREILSDSPSVEALIGTEARTLPLLVAVNAAQFGCAAAAGHLPELVLVPAALTIGSTLSLWSFALMHDIAHGTAALPAGVSRKDALFACSMPSVFGYFLYLRYGHLSHHKSFGRAPLSTLFDSEQAKFEDGDALFVAHRQMLPGDVEGERLGFLGKEAVGGLGLSISRSLYALGWSERAGWVWNAAVYTSSMAFERAALCINDKVTALIGRNLFFPHKPDAFHATCAAHARAQALVHLALVGLAGPGALLWLYCAELGWQLPCHPGFAMFVSNHGSLPNERGGLQAGAAEGGCQPTASIYLGGWYDWVCAFSNYHTEHHDFPDVPLFRLRQLRDLAPDYYGPPMLADARIGWLPTVKRSFEKRGFYACAGVQASVTAPDANSPSAANGLSRASGDVRHGSLGAGLGARGL
jgi:fatty acid desaturase